MKWIERSPRSGGFYFFRLRDEDVYAEMDEPHNDVLFVRETSVGMFAIWLHPWDEDYSSRRLIVRSVDELDGLWTVKLRGPSFTKFDSEPKELSGRGLGRWYWYAGEEFYDAATIVRVDYLGRGDPPVATGIEPRSFPRDACELGYVQPAFSEMVDNLHGQWAGPIVGPPRPSSV